jgi:hypothetical protein
MDDFDVLWEFAEDATQALSLVASNLATEKARSGWFVTFRPAERAAGRFLRTLAVSLTEINGFLKQPARLEDIGGKLEELLAELERVCNVGPPTPGRLMLLSARRIDGIREDRPSRLLIIYSVPVVKRWKLACPIVEPRGQIYGTPLSSAASNRKFINNCPSSPKS